jgi:hypothetical protein
MPRLAAAPRTAATNNLKRSWMLLLATTEQTPDSTASWAQLQSMETDNSVATVSALARRMLADGLSKFSTSVDRCLRQRRSLDPFHELQYAARVCA